jgi:hypothetical protein
MKHATNKIKPAFDHMLDYSGLPIVLKIKDERLQDALP